MTLRIALLMVCLLVGGFVAYLALAAFPIAALAQVVVQVGWTLLMLSAAAKELLYLVWVLGLVFWMGLPRLLLFLVQKWSLVADFWAWLASTWF